MTESTRTKQKHLGRGLESLLGPITMPQGYPSSESKAEPFSPKPLSEKRLHSSYREININSIQRNPYQPRTEWNQQELNDLCESINKNGLIQPIIVRKIQDGFELIAGERRLRAAKMLEMTTIPAIVREASDEQMLEIALVENIHRTDLNPIERAKAYRKYIDTFSLTQSQAAEKLGEDRSVVANYMRLLDLPQEIKQMVIEGDLSMGHARAILSLPTDDQRRKLANKALTGRLTVREVEKMVKQYLSPQQKKNSLKSKPPHISDLENKLTSQLGTKVNIDTQKNGQRGKIVIEFYSIDEFERLIEKMGLSCIED